jgi:hypothetical protein
VVLAEAILEVGFVGEEILRHGNAQYDDSFDSGRRELCMRAIWFDQHRSNHAGINRTWRS